MILEGLTAKLPPVSLENDLSTNQSSSNSLAMTNTTHPSVSDTGGTGNSDPLLSNLWTQLDRIQPTIPDRLSVLILEGVGIQMENSDCRLARLISLAGQKFLTDILVDSMLHWRMSNGQPTGLLNQSSSVTSSLSTVATTTTTTSSLSNQSSSVNPPSSNGSISKNTTSPSSNTKLTGSQVTKPSLDRRATLTLDDLIVSLNNRGIHVARPVYYR